MLQQLFLENIKLKSQYLRHHVKRCILKSRVENPISQCSTIFKSFFFTKRWKKSFFAFIFKHGKRIAWKIHSFESAKSFQILAGGTDEERRYQVKKSSIHLLSNFSTGIRDLEITSFARKRGNEAELSL